MFIFEKIKAFFKRFKFAFFIYSLLILHPFSCVASDLYFQGFNTSASINDFSIISNSGIINLDISSGVLNLSAPWGNKYPALALNFDLPTDYYGVEVRFKYPSQNNFGTGVYFSDVYPINDISPTFGDLILYFMGEPASPNVRYLKSDGNISDPIYYVSSRYDFHVMKYERYGGTNYYYVDDGLLSEQQSTRWVKYIWFGNTILTGDSDNWSPMIIDYIRVWEIPRVEEVPGVSEWYYSQRDPGWAKDEYDSASTWSCKERDIENWGCAMTDGAMVLKRYQINGTDGTEVTPGELNAWLKTQPDGYLGNGLTNWLAITRLVKESHTAGKAPHALEFVRESAISAEKIDILLADKWLPIVNLGGHFVTLYDQLDSNNWLAADPYTGAETTVEKTKVFTSLSYFVPSKTDLSYFLLTSDPGVQLKLFDAGGSELPLVTTQEALKGEIGGNMSKMLKQYYLAKPPAGSYKLEKSGHGDAHLYLYGIDGGVKKETLGWERQYKLSYNPVNVMGSIVEKYDTIPPQVVITTPELTSSRKIEGTASDENGIKRVEIAIQTKRWWGIPFNLWLRAFGTENWLFPINYLPSGEYRVRARAIDKAGNVSGITEKYIKLVNVHGVYGR